MSERFPIAAFIATRAEMPEFDAERVFIGVDRGEHQGHVVMFQRDAEGRVWVLGELHEDLSPWKPLPPELGKWTHTRDGQPVIPYVHEPDPSKET